MTCKRKIMLVGPILENLTNFRRELIETLVKDKYEVLLVCSMKGYDESQIPEGVRVIDVAVDRRGKKAFKDLNQIRQYYKILKRERPDVVLLFTTKCSVYGGIACRLRKQKHIINNSGLVDMSTLSKPVRWVLKMMYRIGYGGADCMMYQNNYERDYFNQLLEGKFYKDIPGSGINLDRYQLKPYPEQSSPITFNYVARIAQFKGIEEYLECARRIKEKYPEIIFRIYGSYDESDYKEVINEMSRNGIVEYQGKHKDMKPAMETCYAVIHPSHYEGLTNVILEHSATGRASIASDIPGCKEAVDDGITGYLFTVNNVEALVSKVENFIKLPYEKKVEMGRSARRKMENEFDRKIVVNTYMEEINRILSK